MATDDKTIAVYDEKVDAYSAAFSAAEADPSLSRFIKHLSAGATVLDLGCGPGSHAAALHANGFEVTATDASSAMVKQTSSHAGIAVRQAEFSELEDQDVFDGIWANFSLLHEPRSNMADHLSRIFKALKPGGIFHIGMKTGSSEGRDHLGRFYTYYSSSELHRFLTDAGFQVIGEVAGEGAGLAGTVDPWVEILSRSSKQA